jgi:hypothetical protein
MPDTHRVSRRTRLLALPAPALLAIALWGCTSSMTDDELAMCDARRQLMITFDQTTVAQAADEAGDIATTRSAADIARTGAKTASDTLFAIATANIRDGNAWAALVAADQHLWQGALALLPGYSAAHGSTPQRLASAALLLEQARTALQIRCIGA